MLTNTPVYGPFLTAPINQQRRLSLRRCRKRAGRQLRYDLDMAGLEKVIADDIAALFLLCNPQNPVGRAFTRNELEDPRPSARAARSHHLLDEIHCDPLLDETLDIPIASLSPAVAQRTITLMAPSKTFNVCQGWVSLAIIQNAALRKQVEQAMAGISRT